MPRSRSPAKVRRITTGLVPAHSASSAEVMGRPDRSAMCSSAWSATESRSFLFM